jgi:hypothetical protein
MLRGGGVRVFFWAEKAEEPSRSVRSTGIPVEGKRERRREAGNAAQAICEELKQGKGKPYTAAPTPADDELHASPPLKQAAGTDTSGSPGNAGVPYIQYLLDFWTPESEYAKHKRDAKKKPPFRLLHFNRVIQKLQFLNNNRLNPAKCGAFCKTCLTTNRVVKQV